jgi:hypothetical protein
MRDSVGNSATDGRPHPAPVTGPSAAASACIRRFTRQSTPGESPVLDMGHCGPLFSSGDPVIHADRGDVRPFGCGAFDAIRCRRALILIGSFSSAPMNSPRTSRPLRPPWATKRNYCGGAGAAVVTRGPGRPAHTATRRAQVSPAIAASHSGTGRKARHSAHQNFSSPASPTFP